MTSGVPWSVKGIDPKARETAKDLARRSGLTLGEWLNQIIEDHGELSGSVRPAGLGSSSSLTEALERLSARIEAAEARSTLAISGIDQSVRGVVSRIAEGEREQTAIAARFEGGLEEITGSQVRLAERLRRLEDEAAGPRSSEAIHALEGALGKVAAHLYEGEAQTQGALAQVRADVAAIAGRLHAVEIGPDHLVDAVVARIAERLEQAEGRTRAAMRGLEASFTSLDERLAQTEERVLGPAGPGAGQGFEHLASDLSLSVDEARSEMAQRLLATTDGRLDRMETVVEEMTQHVHTAERNSAHAIERMGHEVLRLAESLNRRVQGVEHQSAEAVAQVGGEVSRLAGKLETRLHRADGAQAEALEKLGAEIARITERLADRISSAERRSAQAIDEVGEQVVRVTERLNQRYDRSSSDLAERIRQSEERTARLLEDARLRLEQRLGGGPVTAESDEELTGLRGAAPEPDAFPDPYAAASSKGAFASTSSIPPPVVFAHAAPAGPLAFAPPDFAPVETDAEPELEFGREPELEAAAEQASEATAEAEPADVVAFDDFDLSFGDDTHFTDLDFPNFAELDPTSDDPAKDPFEVTDEAFTAAEPEPGPALNPRNVSTRDLIEQARNAARAAAHEKDSKGRKTKSDKDNEAGDLFSSSAFGAKRRKSGSGYKKALMMTAAAVCFSAAGYGYFILKPQIGAATGAVADVGPAQRLDVTVADPQVQLPRAALLLNPQPIAATSPVASPAATPASVQLSRAELEVVYNQAIRLLEAKDRAGLEPLRRAADLGFAPAQFALGKAYEDGDAGLPKDFIQARRWTERAAQAGVPQAMHNLAHYHYNGSGGAKNPVMAVDWFRRAANLGYSDSQFNLGVIYEQGVVVPRNEAEAYKWYLLATRGGDEEDRAQARTAVLRVGPQLSIEARVAAERIAAAFTAQAPNSSVRVARGVAVPAQ